MNSNATNGNLYEMCMIYCKSLPMQGIRIKRFWTSARLFSTLTSPCKTQTIKPSPFPPSHPSISFPAISLALRLPL